MNPLAALTLHDIWRWKSRPRTLMLPVAVGFRGSFQRLFDETTMQQRLAVPHLMPSQTMTIPSWSRVTKWWEVKKTHAGRVGLPTYILVEVRRIETL